MTVVRPDDFEYIQLEDITAIWQQVAFPFANRRPIGKIGYIRYLNLNKVKAMLDQMELTQNQDFVFDNRKTLESNSEIVVKFKDEGNATIAVIKWLGSDWYNGR